MTLKAEIIALEDKLHAAGARIDDVLKVAEVDRSTWTRWKSGIVTGARYDTIARVRQAAEAAIGRAA